MKAAIISFPGSTGEIDIQEALVKEGVHKEAIYFEDEKQTDLSVYDVVILTGGASYGDSLRPGAIAAVTPVAEAINRFAQSGKLLIGFGNGFQILTELHLLPGSFLKNESGETVNGFYEVLVSNSRTFLTNQCRDNQVLTLPVAHKYGQYTASEEMLSQLEDKNQIILSYKNEHPNGSAMNIAGITNESGTVFGFMVKPERAVEKLLGSDDGQLFFQSIIHSVIEGQERMGS